MPDWVNILIRSLVSFSAVFFFTRVIGKRQLSQITFFEYTVGIAIGDMATIIADDIHEPLYKGLLPMFMYTLLPILLSILAMKSKVARNIVEGKARVLIKDGKILEDNLKKERMTSDELMEHLRSKNAFKAADVEFALMESNGRVSVLLKSENLPITPKRIGWSVAPHVEPQAVVMDGNIMDQALSTIGRNRDWLKGELEKQGVTIENVFLGQVDTNGELYLDLFDDKLQVPEPQNLKLTYTTLKKVQADLELYALSTQNEQAKRDYEQCSIELQAKIEALKPFLLR
jgi:uncharacterized membrane protein YcaP (DUF421 family)